MGGLLEECRRVTAGDARLVWVDESFLLQNRAGPWMELPLWLPGDEAAVLQADVTRATSSGLTFRPLEATIRDTLEWARAGGESGSLASGLEPGDAGMRPEREAELLEAWRAVT
jgi:2'-hydroxyisoflavone reductase